MAMSLPFEDGWQMVQNNGQIYYWNSRTGEVAWNKPGNPPPPPSLPPPPPSAPPSLTSGQFELDGSSTRYEQYQAQHHLRCGHGYRELVALQREHFALRRELNETTDEVHRRSLSRQMATIEHTLSERGQSLN